MKNEYLKRMKSEIPEKEFREAYEQTPPPPLPIAVIAWNGRQLNNWMARQGIHPREFQNKYYRIQSRMDARGKKFSGIIKVGEWHKLKDIGDIMDALEHNVINEAER